MKNKFQPKPKRGPALWRTVNAPGFKAQAARLHPENSRAGGIRYRSASEEVRMAIYRPIAEMFKKLNPLCQICEGRGNKPANKTSDVHHDKKRDGLLLFDVRHWIAVCRECHNWIHSNPASAKNINRCEKI